MNEVKDMKCCPLLVQRDAGSSLTMPGEHHERTYFSNCLEKKCAAYHYGNCFMFDKAWDAIRNKNQDDVIEELRVLDHIPTRGEEVDALEMAISALEMRIGKKPKIVCETSYSFFCDCPNCGRRLINHIDGEWIAGEKYNFCPQCSQKIDWSEVPG